MIQVCEVRLLCTNCEGADYWKSQARKFCDFCKCWIADNKPSIEFHEKGRRHQDNVAKKIKYISKKSRKDEKDSLKVDAAIRQMEQAALESYRKDVQNNADLSSYLINQKLQENNLAVSDSGYSGRKIWKEAKGADGLVYYFNELTNETKWTPPNEGFCSLSEQREQKFQETKHQLKIIEKQRQVEGRVRTQEQQKEEEEARAAAVREKMKERRVAEEPPEPVSGPILSSENEGPYGKWKVIETVTKNLDLQLPKQEIEYFPVPAIQEVQPAPKEFKEKTVETLGLGNASFKKRKFGFTNKRNTRQRLEDD